MVRNVVFPALLFGAVVLAPFGAYADPPAPVHPADGPAIEVHPVHGLTVGPGRKLWVFVFPGRENGKGPKPPGGDSSSPSCIDGDQLAYARLGFSLPAAGSVTFNVNDGSIPTEPISTMEAIQASFSEWELAIGDHFDVAPVGGASGPEADGNNTVGWVRIVPRNVLAATWVWTEVDADGIERVTDADIFYNLFQKWTALAACGEAGGFDVGNVGTHEVGHVIGMAHVQDSGAMATMYPSAPKGEVKKRTLTTGDVDGALLAVVP